MSHAITQLDAVIVGVGFAGIYMPHTAGKLGITATVQKSQGCRQSFCLCTLDQA
jgi:hypothetical protein